MRTISILIASLFIPSLFGDEKPLPNKTAMEIARRGNMVELTGTIRSDLIASAFAPPEDDSDKWFVTLVTKPNDADSQSLKHAIEDSKEMAPWVNASDPLLSATHYQVRPYDLKGINKDWLAGLTRLVEEKGLPMVVLQPPRNGKFGQTKTIVKTIHGTCDGEYLAKKLRESIIVYVRAIDDDDASLAVRGERPYTEKPPEAPIAVAPPFNVTPKQVERPERERPQVPFEFPPAKSPVLSYEEIEEACPGCPPEFLLSVVRGKETDVKTVKLQWLVYKMEHKPELKPTPIINRNDDDESEVVPAKSFFHEANTTAYIGAAAILLLVGMFLTPILQSARKKAVEIGEAIAIVNAKKLAPITNPATVAPTLSTPVAVSATSTS